MSKLQRKRQRAREQLCWTFRLPKYFQQPGKIWGYYYEGDWCFTGPMTKREAVNEAYSRIVAKDHKLTITFGDKV